MTNSIVKSTEEILIDINAIKTSLLIFTRMKVGLPELHLVINNILVKPSQHCRYLGIELDSKLKWKRHITHKCVSVKALIFSLQRYLRLTWELDYKTLKLYYSAVLVPTMLYGVSVWASALRYKWCKNMLRSTQRTMIKFMVRSFKSVSKPALIVLSNTLPLDLKAYEIATSRYLFLKENDFSPMSKKSINWVLNCVGTGCEVEKLAKFHSRMYPPWSHRPNMRPLSLYIQTTLYLFK